MAAATVPGTARPRGALRCVLVAPHGIGKVVVCVHSTAGGRLRELAGTAAVRGRVRLRLAGVLAYRDLPGVIMVIR